MKHFELLKRTYPVSQIKRICDGYDYIVSNSTKEERKSWKIDDDDLQREIDVGEKYIYQVAKMHRQFRNMCLCFSNYEIIRKYLHNFEDD